MELTRGAMKCPHCGTINHSGNLTSFSPHIDTNAENAAVHSTIQNELHCRLLHSLMEQQVWKYNNSFYFFMCKVQSAYTPVLLIRKFGWYASIFRERKTSTIGFFYSIHRCIDWHIQWWIIQSPPFQHILCPVTLLLSVLLLSAAASTTMSCCMMSTELCREECKDM